jgi:uncharacterized protein (TIGR03085 family)
MRHDRQMSSSSHARRERLELAELMLKLGPDAPTLCEGWTTRHLAAHLVVRESRPDAAAGIIGGPLAAWTERVTNSTATHPYPELVRKVRTGPPTLSWFSLPGMDGLGNLTEYVVHHEDVRRAADGWEPRELSSSVMEALWQRLRMAKFVLRKAPVGVELVRDDLPAKLGGQRVRITAKARTPVVTVAGSPAELTLWALGRTGAARVRFEGSEPDVRKLTDGRWRH